VTFVMNQGALILTGPDGNVDGLPIIVPNVYFWDAHYALASRVVRHLAASFEVNTTVQLNHVDGLDFQQLNRLVAVALVAGLQLHVGAYRVDAVARLGITRGAEVLGVVGYSGTRSYILRLTRLF